MSDTNKVPCEGFRVIVLGLDGATYDLMDRWIAEGHLPNLSNLIRRGARSNLESTTPPITPCAWTSFMTGKNPGKHGLFDFVEPTANGKGFRFTNATSRHSESIWHLLSRMGRKVNVVNVPMTFPPEEVNGCLISGLDTPHEDSEYTFPPSLKTELKKNSIGYRLELQHLGNMRSDAKRDQQLAEMHAIESIRTETLRYLDKKYPADFQMLVYGATDQVSHHFWHYMDPHHAKHDPAGVAKYENAIRDVYRHVDTLVGSVLEGVDNDTVVILMSDHGFGPTTNVRIRLNQILEAHGLLTFVKEGAFGRIKRTIGGWLDRILRGVLSPDFKRALAGRFPRLRVWFEQLDEGKIDWSRTRAYTNEAFRSSPAIWINRQDMTGTEYEATLEEVEAIIRGLKDPATGQPAVSNVYRTRDYYDGPYSENAPDLLVSWWEDGFLLEQSVAGGAVDLQVERSTAPLTGGVEFAGSHRLNGVFAIAGGPTRQGLRFEGASIVDVVPTVLYMMGLPIPADMDGRPLVEAFEPEFVKTHPPKRDTNSSTEIENSQQVQHDFDDEESSLVRERLQALGYIE